MSKNLKFPVLEMFISIQGEGMYTGEPSLFVRVGGCNLRCVFGDSRCDTPYSSFELEPSIYDDPQTAAKGANELLNENPQVRHIVITGGEPMLYQNAIKEFINNIDPVDENETSIKLTIETNGTLQAFNHWTWDSDYFDSYVDLWSVSPKLSTSVDKNLKYLTKEKMENHDKTRINITSLASYILTVNADSMYIINNDLDLEYPKIQFKFVYTDENSVTEIKDILLRLKEEYGYDMSYLNSLVMLMPEGTTEEQIKNKSQECVEVCLREGWRFCDRLHIRIWGDKRKV